MTALATSTDVEVALGRTLTDAEYAKAEGALLRASDLIRTLTGRRYEAGTVTVRRKVRNGRIELDQPEAVSQIVLVNDNGTETELTGWTLRGSTVYGLGACEDWVEATYTVAGDVPQEIVGVCAAMAGRDITSERPQGATSYTVTRGPFTESASFEDAQDAVEPTSAEAKVLAKFAVRFGPVSLV